MRFSRVFNDGWIDDVGLNQAATASCRAFVFCPIQPTGLTGLANTSEIYRLAFEQAQALVLAPKYERLFGPSLN